MQSPYYICPNKIYPAHKPGDETVYATVEVITDIEKVEITEYTKGAVLGEECIDGEISQIEYEDWEIRFKAMGYVMLPLVERGGVCVTIDESDKGLVGVLLKFPSTGSQFNHLTGCCQALIKSDNTVANVGYKDALDSIIPVGTEMWWRMRMHRVGREMHDDAGVLRVRLTVPNVAVPTQGKVYVAAEFKSIDWGCHPNAQKESIVFEVDPWDLRMRLETREENASKVYCLDRSWLFNQESQRN